MSTITRTVTKAVVAPGPSCPHASIEGEMSTLAIGLNERDAEDLIQEDLVDLKSESDLIDLSSMEDSKTIEMTPITEQTALSNEQVAADDSGESKITVGSDDTTLVSESEPPLPAAAESSLTAVPESSLPEISEPSLSLAAEPSPPVVTEPPLQMAAESSPPVAAEPSAPVTVPTADSKPEEKDKKPSLMEARIQGGLAPRIRPRKIGTSGDLILAGHVGDSPVIHVVTPIERFLRKVKTKTSDGYRFIPQEPDRYVLEKRDEKTTATTQVKDEITDSGDKPKEEGAAELNNDSSHAAANEQKRDNTATDLKDEVSQPDNKPKQETATAKANSEILQPDTDLIDLTDPDSQTDGSTPDEDTPTTSQVVGNEFSPDEPSTQSNEPPNTNTTPLASRNPFATFPPPISRDPSGKIKYNYQSYFEIKESPVGGLGAFAVKDLYRGDVILMEAPILRTTGFNLFRDFRALDKDTREIYLSLHAVEEDGVNKIERIRRANAFEIPSGIAILAIGSRFNHGCGPKRSVSYTYDAHRNMMVFEVVADFVPSGQELFVTYGGTPAQLFRTFGFRCRCGGCDGLRDEDIRRLRAEERGETYYCPSAAAAAAGRMGTRYGTRYGTHSGTSSGAGTRYHGDGGGGYAW